VLPVPLDIEDAPTIRRSSRSAAAPAPAKAQAPSGQNVTFAHELRRRLAALRVLSEAIEVRTAEADVDRLVHMLVQELHDLEELEAAMLGSARREALDDVDVLETAQAAAQTVSWARKSQIKVQGSKRSLRIRSNPTMLRQALENLIDNAATCGLGAPVDVAVRSSVSRRLPGIEVLVADRGPGLGRAPATRRSGGGVGLQLVRKFVQESGGRLWSRDREGGGAEFGIWLPAGRLASLTDDADSEEAAHAEGTGTGVRR
jgi:signal transduction histidine kinase